MNKQDQLYSKNNLNDLGNKLIYLTRDNNLFTFNQHQCSAQRQVLRCKLRHQDYNSAQMQVLNCRFRNLGCSLLGMNRCGSFPLLSAHHALFSI